MEPFALSAVTLGRYTRLLIAQCLKRFGINVAAYLLLHEVAKQPGLHGRELARRLDTSRQQIIQAGRQLQSRHLLEIRRDRPGAKLGRMHPTTTGTELLAAMMPLLARLDRRLTRGLPATFQESFSTRVERLTRASVLGCRRELSWRD